MDLPEWCGQCNRATRHMNTPGGPRRCPACHPLAAKHLGQYRRCPDCAALIREWDRSDCGSHERIREIERSSS